jgi:RNA recognition motif. (a.k.a. RRM, RBD, or RNP domain)
VVHALIHGFVTIVCHTKDYAVARGPQNARGEPPIALRLACSLQPPHRAHLCLRSASCCVMYSPSSCTGRRRYVGNIPWSAQVDDLRQLFSQYGEVEDAFIPQVTGIF